MASRASKKKGTAGKKTAKKKAGRRSAGPVCGLCGKKGKLIRTECCGNWICDDHEKYVLFSYAHNSCRRNHDRYTLCGHHRAEAHAGDWQECQQCRDDFETEIYVYYGTNEHNFVKLANPPAFEPKHCSECGRVIVLAEGGYSTLRGEYWCEDCTAASL